MKSIEKLRDAHKGKRIFVIGTGYSLDGFPEDFDDFFDDKISCAIGAAFTAFPNCTYIVTGHIGWAVYILNEDPSLLKKCIFAWPLCQGRTRWRRPERLGKYGKYSFAFPRAWIGTNEKKFLSLLRPTIDAIVNRQAYKLPALCGVVHRAMLVAFILGAREITLIGCEGKDTNGRSHGEKRGLSDIYSEIYNKYPVTVAKRKIIQSKQRKGIKWLAEAFSYYDVKVSRCYYNECSDEINYERITDENMCIDQYL